MFELFNLLMMTVYTLQVCIFNQTSFIYTTLRQRINFKTKDHDWKYVVHWDSSNLNQDCSIDYSATLIDQNSNETLYLLEPYTALGNTLFCMINATNGEYINNKWLISNTQVCQRMINHYSSIYILWYSNGSKLLKYNKTSDELSYPYTLSSDIIIYDIGDLYTHSNSEHLLFVGSSSFSLSVYIGKTISNKPDIHKDISYMDNSQL